MTLSRDIHDLLDSHYAMLRAILELVGRNPTILLIAGTPCQDLTADADFAGPRGRFGVCGKRSRLIVTVRLLGWAIRQIRPDAAVYANIGTAGCMLPAERGLWPSPGASRGV